VYFVQTKVVEVSLFSCAASAGSPVVQRFVYKCLLLHW
jgi:hypothetical protein